MILISIAKQLISKTIKLSTMGFRTSTHITRYYMYEHLSLVFRTLNSNNNCNSILSISESEQLCNLLGLKEPKITKANFPEYNILKLPFSDNQFDYVVSDQVLEHVEGNPQQAIDETYRILKPGGKAIHTTCFFNEKHGDPKDFWRFTPEALLLLCSKFSKVIDVGGWGNKYAVLICWLGLRFQGIPDTQWHPLHKIAIENDKNTPIVTWIVVQK